MPAAWSNAPGMARTAQIHSTAFISLRAQRKYQGDFISNARPICHVTSLGIYNLCTPETPNSRRHVAPDEAATVAEIYVCLYLAPECSCSTSPAKSLSLHLLTIECRQRARVPWTLCLAYRWDCVNGTFTSVLLTRDALAHTAPLQHVLVRPLGRGEKFIHKFQTCQDRREARVVCQRKTGADGAPWRIQRSPHRVCRSHHLALANAFEICVLNTIVRYLLQGGPLLRVGGLGIRSRSDLWIASKASTVQTA